MSSSPNGKIVLLTGAGFTYNFGGFLADQMWALIFNHKTIQKYPRIKESLLEDGELNYEAVYEKVLGSDFKDEEKESMKEIVRESYDILDKNIIDPGRLSKGRPINELNKLIERFSENMGGSGYFFTLNQDLFIERFFNSTNTKLCIPGVRNKIWSIGTKVFLNEYLEFIAKDTKEIEKKEPISASKFHYIKLHGSFNWKKTDGSDALVIGIGKMGFIEDEPLLNWYFQLFKEELAKKNARLLVIGYGFGDLHINGIISNAIKNSGLKLYVISRKTPKHFRTSLVENSRLGTDGIWNGLCGYLSDGLMPILENENNQRRLIESMSV